MLIQIFIGILLIFSLIIFVMFLYMRMEKFGKTPSAARLERIKQSPNYMDGKFQNVHPTPQLTEGYNMPEVAFEFMFKKKPQRTPTDNIPTMKINLLTLPANKDILVWFGHSSYFIQVDGKKMLVDPVLSGNASPVPGSNKAFTGVDVYTVDDLPEIDYLFITHDHYDHLDYETIVALKPKTGKVICGLGVGAHFEHWGYEPEKIIEKDWNETIELDNGFTVYTAPTRHFSGRGFSRNNTLWMSFILQTPTMKIYIGGDSGYDTHFAEIGEKYGPIDLAILDNGQYDDKWKYIHMHPEEVLQAAKDLKAKRTIPVHSAKFAMANHPWNEPLTQITELNKKIQVPLITPIIGEPVHLKDEHQQFKHWWQGLK